MQWEVESLNVTAQSVSNDALLWVLRLAGRSVEIPAHRRGVGGQWFRQEVRTQSMICTFLYWRSEGDEGSVACSLLAVLALSRTTGGERVVVVTSGLPCNL
jgi:hypothetical protein